MSRTSEQARLRIAPADGETTDGPGRNLIVQLRRFHQGEPGAGAELQSPDSTILPPALHLLRDPRLVRDDYPLVLFAADAAEQRAVGGPLSEYLESRLDEVATASDDLQIVRENLVRLEAPIRQAMQSVTASMEARPVIEGAAERLEQSLNLRGDSGKQFHDGLERLVQSIAEDARMLPLSDRTPLELMLHAARRHVATTQKALRDEAERLLGRLRDLIRVDDRKSETADDPAAVRGSTGDEGATHLDSEALARMLKTTRRSKAMPTDRRRRIEATIESLREFLKQRQSVIVVTDGPAPEDGETAGDVEWRTVGKEERVGAVAMSAFDELAASWSGWLGALRVARLELANAFDANRHQPLLDSFDWRRYSREELLALPPVVAIVSADRLVQQGMFDVTRILMSARPVQIITVVHAAVNPGEADTEESLHTHRVELGYLGISYREAVVNQSSAARPHHLADGYLQGLESGRPSLHVVTSGLTADGQPPVLGAWLQTGAALEGRAHPLFHYNPNAGQTWARRLDFTSNPDPEADWPSYELSYLDAQGDEQVETAAFTFADYALLEPRFAGQFRIVPSGVDDESLIPLNEYLALTPDEAAEHIPFVWAADGSGRLRRLVLTRDLVFVCQDRLDYWRTLQELAGVRNEYVREAVERERERLGAEFDEEREKLEADHATKIEEVRAQAANEAFQRLAQTLLETDISALASSAVRPATGAAPPPAPEASQPATAPAETEPAEPAAIEEEEEEDEGFDEPWIESALCTSCNDCMQINPRLFVYTPTKQAMIGDPKAGTFAELVKAAEICPARCIHPGKPQNPDEPNLEELIERAKPFNK